MRRSSSAPLIVGFVVLAVAGMVLAAASVPHLHVDDDVGFYNHEHDLTLLAGLAAHVLPVEAVTAGVPLDPPSIPLPSSVAERPALRLGSAGDSRAPPVR